MGNTATTSSVEPRSAIHSFSTIQHKNGNITITFFEGTRQRHIKLTKGTVARDKYVQIYNEISSQLIPDGLDDEQTTYDAFFELRSDFTFHKHPSNSSIFYPKSRR